MKQLLVALKIVGIGLVCLLPTPTYGKHGGFYKESKGKPIDPMDAAFERHDRRLERSYAAWQSGIESANALLITELKEFPPNRNWYARAYHKMSLVIFKSRWKE